MRIPAYQIYNVLRQYTDRLTGSGSDGDQNGPGQARPVDEVELFAVLKRREVIETVTEKIKETVIRLKSSDRQERGSQTRSSAAPQEGSVVKEGEFTPFVYNVIDSAHRKVKRTISVTRFYEP